MAKALASKAALIIGGTRGIGGAISRQLAADGASVAMTHVSRADEAAEFARELRSTGVEALAIQADAGDPEALLQAMDSAVASLGRLDILVYNAGINITGPLEDYAPDAFDRLFAVNVRGAFLAAQKAARMMADGGRIILTGSAIAERVPGPGVTLYATSKAALSGMVRGLARDLGGRGITANLVQPGLISTERNPPGSLRADVTRIPVAIRRIGMPEEVAALVAFLASDAAAYITGSVYNVDGGMNA